MDAGAREVLRRAFAAQLPEPDRAGAPPGVSAVLVPVVAEGAACSLVYTRRAQALRSHPGEVSFPGGRVDPGDASPLGAALREAEEEIGLSPSDVDVVGHLTDFLTYRNQLVCAYVGVLREGVEPPRVPRSVDEVEEVFEVPVPVLLDPSVYEARRLPGMPADRRVHYWRVAPRTIWGITGELTARYLARVHGWSPPARVREVASLEEFRPEVLP